MKLHKLYSLDFIFLYVCIFLVAWMGLSYFLEQRFDGSYAHTNRVRAGYELRDYEGVKLVGMSVQNTSWANSGESDAKVIAVPVKDARWDEVQDLEDINKHTLKEMEHFFTTYKGIEGKVVTINGFEGKDKAIEAFKRSQDLYKEKFDK